ncbi:hypothetical protein ELH42_36450 [Rhizobium ruizarguesonis]|uniref:Uncharacterized protein n=1 Tax=Rhizobium ruizarguesonis TaxID=2081791 RepID=A0AAE8TYD1_9HYPH|nr:hypothetical protein ELH61_29135 [Rhizobium ruizarguesonis]TBA72861.1 hypothetical protein ELH56_34925 [Rhizobium ruizarguesonis]TBB57819.1 hypothetical protein ELH42_36450 [Rhizobium ruizarguesonis]TBB60402.1 hypothetical protein ELH45_34265 [Rhizobium ruizarguesonis]TBB82893.1 hypothetical protein ELH39_32920 [Rhizobium ruizarguesonis]
MACSLQELSPGSRHHHGTRISVSKRSRTSSPSCRLPAREVEAVAGPAIPLTVAMQPMRAGAAVNVFFNQAKKERCTFL